ncbi:MAG: type II toxin-antitoxin system HicB family antitoxin [Fimbriimonadaceae bacterium]
MRQALVYRGESGLWVAEVPSLPGCVSQGATFEEAVENVREAIDLHIETLEQHHQPVPGERFEAMLIAV